MESAYVTRKENWRVFRICSWCLVSNPLVPYGVYCANAIPSSCVAVAFRLADTINYGRVNDLTYAESPVIMWSMGEITAGFLVFCVPAVPMALGNMRISSMISNVFCSWKIQRAKEQKPLIEELDRFWSD
jgi:hypothetical protein